MKSLRHEFESAHKNFSTSQIAHTYVFCTHSGPFYFNQTT